MAHCLQLKYFSVSGDRRSWGSEKAAELITPLRTCSVTLGNTCFFWASGSWLNMRRLKSSCMDFKFSRRIPVFL